LNEHAALQILLGICGYRPEGDRLAKGKNAMVSR